MERYAIHFLYSLLNVLPICSLMDRIELDEVCLDF